MYAFRVLCSIVGFVSFFVPVALQSLPDFGDRLRARDCELMLQYLTVPYLRIPLVIKFFSDPVRMQVQAVVILAVYCMLLSLLLSNESTRML